MLAISASISASPAAAACATAGAARPEQLEANVKAGDWTLFAEEMAEVDRLTPP